MRQVHVCERSMDEMTGFPWPALSPVECWAIWAGVTGGHVDSQMSLAAGAPALPPVAGRGLRAPCMQAAGVLPPHPRAPGLRWLEL